MSAGDTTQGRRLPDGFHYRDSEAGDYWKQLAERGSEQFTWTIRDPTGAIGSIGKHTVIEHEDGTITVSPSILNDAPGGWHGFLERGVWREV